MLFPATGRSDQNLLHYADVTKTGLPIILQMKRPAEVGVTYFFICRLWMTASTKIAICRHTEKPGEAKGA
jgi:hypothetical protein